MNKIDLIIDALEGMCGNRCNTEYNLCQASVALAAARELKALKPVAIRNPINGVIEVQWGASESVPLGTKLYALEDTK
jgi:hypothetical protein